MEISIELKYGTNIQIHLNAASGKMRSIATYIILLLHMV